MASMSKKSVWNYFDEKPTWREPTEEEYDEFLSLLIDEVVGPNGPSAHTRDVREEKAIGAQVASLQDRVRAYARSLTDSVTPAQRVQLAAPPAKKVKTPHGAFNARHPAYVEERHGPYKDTARGFSDIAQRLGRGSAWGAVVKNEMVLIALSNGAVPLGSIDGRKRNQNADEGLIAAALFPALWNSSHELDLLESERAGLTQEFLASAQLQSSKAALLRELWHAMTMTKVGRHPANIRALLKVLATTIDACREEIRP